MKILENRYLKILLFIIAAIILNVAAITFADFDVQGELKLNYTVKAATGDNYQVFYSKGETWSEHESIKLEYTNVGEPQVLSYVLPTEVKRIRLDLGDKAGEIQLSNISLNYLWKKINIDSKALMDSEEKNAITTIKEDNDIINIVANNNDPYIVLELDTMNISELFILSR
ncbi:MAG: hypothetical protein RR776_12670, partial [Niameybacter sp.]|uniref:hypothetical protein n=1 Tax=Niameybacter sp. TaxID=2033640 RepID=UPI002FC80D33